MENEAKKGLKELAQEAITLSPLMGGREKVSTEEVIRAYPDGFTVDAVDMVETETDVYPVFTLKEDEHVFYCGGIVLKKIVSEWINFYGDIKTVNEAIRAEEIRVVLEISNTKDKKKSLTKVTIK